jgi:prepilin-type N-terminal cleavage/methylation domain-containing protein
MKKQGRQSGLTLTEMIVVVGVISLLAFFGMPAVRMLLRSFETEGGTRSMIQAALSSARAIAARDHRYAGLRFQRAYHDDGMGSQYMIFIVHDYDGATGPVNRFRALEGSQPIRLPDSVMVVDPNLGSSIPVDSSTAVSGLVDLWQLRDATSFSIIFSPTGKLVRHDVRVLNSGDDTFDTLGGGGMFLQDGAGPGLVEELSRIEFLIFGRVEFEQITIFDDRVAYLTIQDEYHTNYVNAYTGRLISLGR